MSRTAPRQATERKFPVPALERTFPLAHVVLVYPDARSRKFPLIAAERVFPLPAAERKFPLEATGLFLLELGEGRRILLGQLGHPFRDLFVDNPDLISAVEWRKDGDPDFTVVTAGVFPGVLEAARFVEFTPQRFDTDLKFVIRLTDTSGNKQAAELSIRTDVKMLSDKVGQVNQVIKPFADATFSEDATLVLAVKYEITGASTVAKTAIPRKVVVSGTHNGASDSASLIDTTKDFLALGVRINDIVKNTTDGSQAKVTALATTTNPNDTLTLDGLTGGTDNDFDASDAYTVEDGDNLILIAQKFEHKFTATGAHVVTLYVTDTQGNEFSDLVVVEIS